MMVITPSLVHRFRHCPTMIFHASPRAITLRAAPTGRMVGGVFCLTTGVLFDCDCRVYRDAKSIPLARGMSNTAEVCLRAIAILELSGRGRRCCGDVEAKVWRFWWHRVPLGKGGTMWMRLLGGVLGMRLMWGGILVGDAGEGCGRGGVPGVWRMSGQLMFFLQAV